MYTLDAEGEIDYHSGYTDAGELSIKNGFKIFKKLDDDDVRWSGEGPGHSFTLSDQPSTDTAEGGDTGEELDAGYSGAFTLAATATAMAAMLAF